MTMCLEKARRAWVRLPRPLHGALLELRSEHPRPTVFSTSQFVQFEPRLRDWGLTEITTAPNGINGEQVQVVSLNRLGVAFAKHLSPLPTDRRSLPPLMPLADVLADLPQPVFDWISGPPPIEKHPGGILFEAMGVLLPTFRGDAYNPSRELTLALEEVAFRNSGGALRKDGPAVSFLTPELTDALRLILDSNGVPWKDGGIDGRAIRSICDTDGCGLVTLRDIYDNSRPGAPPNAYVIRREWVVPHMMKPVARALVDGEIDPFKLVILMPNEYREWVADGLPLNKVPPHPRLLALIGVIKKKGKYDWQFVKDYFDVQPRVAAFLRAYENGVTIPDEEAYDGEGVDIVLPDEDGPTDSGWDILGATPEQVAYLNQPGFSIEPATPGAVDTLAALDSLIATAGDAAKVVEAPVPSNAELAAAKARREARHPVADLSLDDEFDIL